VTCVYLYDVQVPLVVPVIVLLACVYLLVAPIVQNPGGSGSFTLLILLLGIIAYVPFVYMRLTPPGMGKCP
jgi:L-type amino acid transporter 9